MRDRNLLTRAEFHVMHHLWSLPEQKGYAGDILKSYEDPKPAYTTVATFLKILETKGFIKSQKKGHKVIFKPTLTRQEYAAIVILILRTTSLHGVGNSLERDDTGCE